MTADRAKQVLDDGATNAAVNAPSGGGSTAGVGAPTLPTVRLADLRLADFRNYSTAKLSFDRPFVVLVGANGAGKTNLMEAVSLLTPGRGLRRAVHQDMARQGAAGTAPYVSGGFALSATVLSHATESSISIKVLPDPSGTATRAIRIDETVAKSADELLDLLRILWLTPAMDGLFTGPGSDRRRFLDRMVLAIDPTHGRRASDYERAMRSRNKLLADNRMDDSWLSGLEAQMAELGVAMAMARAELVRLLAGMIETATKGNPFPKAGLDLLPGYADFDPAAPSADNEDRAAVRLRTARGQDRAIGRTLEGAHRAELQVTHLDKNMPAALASTGEQKALLIGLVLAHARLVTAVSGLPPVLLLDEIAAHLDPARRAALFDLIADLGVQAFMTGTDAGLFAALGDRAQMLEVAGGAVSPMPLPAGADAPRAYEMRTKETRDER